MVEAGGYRPPPPPYTLPWHTPPHHPLRRIATRPRPPLHDPRWPPRRRHFSPKSRLSAARPILALLSCPPVRRTPPFRRSPPPHSGCMQ